VPFTLRNIKEDLEDIGSRFDGAPDLEFRAATEALALEKSGLSYQRVPPGYRFPYGHTHKTQEEVYVVVRGSGRMKVDEEIVELKEWDAVRVRPARGEATRPGRRASRSSSSARPTSVRLRAKTSKASATGGLTSRGVRVVARAQTNARVETKRQVRRMGQHSGMSPDGAWWADSSATAQPRLWLTTSTLCPSGSSTNAP
jgi:hypothetical protein